MKQSVYKDGIQHLVSILPPAWGHCPLEFDTSFGGKTCFSIITEHPCKGLVVSFTNQLDFSGFSFFFGAHLWVAHQFAACDSEHSAANSMFQRKLCNMFGSNML